MVDLLGFLPGLRPRGSQRAADAITELDLEAVLAKCMARHGWSHERAGTAAHNYRRFLYLLALNPKRTIVPWSRDLDLLWHEHILDTRRYGADCERIFGYFVHHNPNTARTQLSQHADRQFTRRIYHRTFATS